MAKISLELRKELTKLHKDYYSKKISRWTFQKELDEIYKKIEMEKAKKRPKPKIKKEVRKRPEPKKFVMRTIKRKNGGTYKRKVLSESWKNWRADEAKISKMNAKYDVVRRKLIKESRNNWKRASYWDPKQKKMIYYKDIMTFKEFIEMRMRSYNIKFIK